MADWEHGEGDPPRWVKWAAAALAIGLLVTLMLPVVFAILGWPA